MKIILKKFISDAFFKSIFFQFFLVFLYFVHNLFYIFKVGHGGDETGMGYASGSVFEKIIYIFRDFNDERLLNFLGNGEFYGFTYYLPAHLISNSGTVHKLFNYFLSDTSFVDVNNFNEVVYVTKFIILNFYLVIFLIVIILKMRKLTNYEFTTLFLIFLFITPSFLGHSIFNTRDIPFALTIFIATLYIFDYIKNRPNRKFSEKEIFYLGVAIGLSASIRVNAYAFISLIIPIIFYFAIKNHLKVSKFFKDISKAYLWSFLILYILTPSAWRHPIIWFNGAIIRQFDLQWSGSTLTNGKYFLALEMDWEYLVVWFFYKLPIVFLILFFISLIFLINKEKFSDFLYLAHYFIFTVLFSFVVYKPAVYDGLRQFLFLFPFLIVIFVDAYFKIINKFKIEKFKYHLLLVIVLFSFYSQRGLGEYKYLYFNEFVDEQKISINCDNIDGCGNWLTDYWGLSGKQMAKYINKNINNFENDYILVCRPYEPVIDYLKTPPLKVIRNVDLSSNIDNAFVVTFHRPRFNDDSCYFLYDSITYECEDIYVNQIKLRDIPINLGYIHKCTFS